MDEQTRIMELEAELESYRQAEQISLPIWRTLNAVAPRLGVLPGESHEVTVNALLAALDAAEAKAHQRGLELLDRDMQDEIRADVEAENERLKARVNELIAQSNMLYARLNAAEGRTGYSIEAEALAKENVWLRAALEPFATVYGTLYRDYDNDDDPSGITIWSDYDRQTRKSASLTVLDLRGAFQALYPTTKGADNGG